MSYFPFFGGTWHGQYKLIEPIPKFVVVPVPPTSARPEDFLNLDYKAEPRQDQIYKLWHLDFGWGFVLERIEER
jgi:hypothetical protein